MICKKFANILYNKVWDCKLSQIRHSALFINGAKATENFVYITPHVDIKELIENKETIARELKSRKDKSDLNKVENLYQVYMALKTQVSEYTKKKEEISKELAKLFKSNADSDLTQKFKIQSDLMKENIKKLKNPLWSSEEAVMLEVLKLPNRLHSKTPINESEILYEQYPRPKNNKDHLQIAMEQQLINFTKHNSYYLIGKSAEFELGAKFYFNNILRQNKFIQFSNPDFVKSLIVEGCGSDHVDPDTTFILHHNEDTNVNVDNRLHLTGGGSLFSFMAYHAKTVITAKMLPLKYFSMGRQYLPSEGESNLLNASQASVIKFFGVAKTSEQSDKMLDEMIDVVKQAYEPLGYHFRLSLVKAEQLKKCETLRVAIEMYSGSQERYIEVGNISMNGDYLSKRLMFTYSDNKANLFPHIISGTLLNVPKFLACVLEQDKEFDVPESFRVHSWTNI